MVVDVVVLHFKRTKHSQKKNTKVGTLRSVQVAVEQKSQWRPIRDSVKYFVSRLLYSCMQISASYGRC